MYIYIYMYVHIRMDMNFDICCKGPYVCMMVSWSQFFLHIVYVPPNAEYNVSNSLRYLYLNHLNPCGNRGIETVKPHRIQYIQLQKPENRIQRTWTRYYYLHLFWPELLYMGMGHFTGVPPQLIVFLFSTIHIGVRELWSIRVWFCPKHIAYFKIRRFGIIILFFPLFGHQPLLGTIQSVHVFWSGYVNRSLLVLWSVEAFQQVE